MSDKCENCEKYEELKKEFNFIKTEYDIIIKEHEYYEKIILDAFEKNNLLPVNKDNFKDADNKTEGTGTGDEKV
jgi:hypothetical protein